MKSRTIKDGPWTWASKPALNLIRNGCENYASTIAVYHALCEIASNAGQEEFDTTIAHIGLHCGLSRQTICNELQALEHLGLLDVQNNTTAGLKRPSTYTLLRCKRGATQYAAITSKTLEKEAKAYGEAHESHLLKR